MKISADLIDLDMGERVVLRYKPKPRTMDWDCKSSFSWPQFHDQIVQNLNLSPLTSPITVYFKKQNKKIVINSDKSLQEAFEHAASQGKQLELTVVEGGEDVGSGREGSSSDVPAARPTVSFLPPPPADTPNGAAAASNNSRDEEELAWVKQHGWMRALIQEVESKAHAVAVSHLVNLFSGLTPSEAKKKIGKQGLPDFGVMCNLCNNVVLGPYYKCSVCEDFDICSKCESSPTASSHDESHPLLKIRAPGKLKKSLAHHHSVGIKRKRDKHPFKHMYKHIGFKPYDASCKDTRHMYSVEPGQSFTEVWTIENTGLKAWDHHVYLKCCANSGAAVVPVLEKVSVPVRLPCDVALVPVTFTILPGPPQGPSPCISMWRLCRKDLEFGPILMTTFTVTAPRSLEVSTANTPNNTPFVLSPPKSPEPSATLQETTKDQPQTPKQEGVVEEEDRCSSNSSESEDSEFVVIPSPAGDSQTNATPPEKEDSICQDLECISDSMGVLSIDGNSSLPSSSPPPCVVSNGSGAGDYQSAAPPQQQYLEEDEEALRVLVTKVNLLRQSPDSSSATATEVKTRLSPYPCLAEVAAATASLPQSPGDEEDDSSAVVVTQQPGPSSPAVAPAVVVEHQPPPVAQTVPMLTIQPPPVNTAPPKEQQTAAEQPLNPSQQACGVSPPTFLPYPHDGLPVLPISMVTGVASQVYNTAKAVIQQLTPPTSTVAAAPPSHLAPPPPADSQGEFVYPPEAWIGHHMTSQEYQYFKWKFSPSIECFREMGFKDQIRIEYLLQKFNGDVNKVANTLLCDPAEDPDNNWFLTRHQAFDFD